MRDLTYGELERFLAFRHDANFEQMRGALRGRIKHLQKLGFPSETAGAGKGQRARYAPHIVGKVAVAFELLACGMAPVEVVYLVEGEWALISRVFVDNNLIGPYVLRCALDFFAYRGGSRWRVHVIDSLRAQPGMRRALFVDLLSVRRDLDAFLQEQGA